MTHVSSLTLALLALASFGAGFVDAIAGGGGLLTVPSLVAAGLPPHFVLGTNKGQAVFGAVTSLASFWRKGALARDRVGLGLLTGFIGSCLGTALVLYVRPEPLRPLIVVLLLIALLLVFGARALRARGADRAYASTSAWRFGAIAIAMGAYDGFFGPGTGSLLIAAFVAFMGESETRASGNAKIVNFASNAAALLVFAWNAKVLWSISLPMAAANAGGAWLGARSVFRGGDKLVRWVLTAVVLALSAKLLVGFARP
ncbi:MAG: TSUP family transporter [Polyangiaceae bacterium]